MEHNAVMRPLHQLAAQGVRYDVIPADRCGNMLPEEAEGMLRPETRAVISTHASNVCGTVQPIAALGQCFKDPMSLYEALSEWYRARGLYGLQHSRQARYEHLLAFAAQLPGMDTEAFRELLTMDMYLRENLKSRAGWMRDLSADREQTRQFYRREEETRRYLPDYASFDRQQLNRMTHLEYFPRRGEWLLFDYGRRDPLTQNARTVRLLPKK